MYDLSAILTGHSADVRSVCLDDQGYIITGSRDNTAIVWEKVGDNPDTPAAQRWVIKRKLTGHTNFVNAVAALPGTPDFPTGLIVTGGQDTKILIHSMDIPEPINALTGHTEGVTCLSTGRFGTIVSGSSDMTVRVWLDMQCTTVMKGHTGPVWDVAIYPGEGLYLSASGDKTIKLWQGDKCTQTFEGHTDAVRKVLVQKDGLFLSCSNDGSVRQWAVNGQCVANVSASDSFLYSMALIPTGFTVTGENGVVAIVQEGVVTQSVQVPALSVWCSAALLDGDIVVGSSDGLARVFTPVQDRLAPLADRERMKEEISAQKHSKKAIGDLETDKLPGVEALCKAGTEGQTLMVKNGKIVELHKYSGGTWQKIGDVTDAYDKEKHELDGQTYDHVIDVDVEDGSPALKLGCNKGDDAWQVAQDFITKHALSQSYLSEIAQYIISNTGLGETPMDYSSGYSDPFTGGSRYVPSAAPAAPVQYGGDPFTGANAYRPDPAPSAQGNTIAGDPYTGAGGLNTGGAAKYYPQTKVIPESVPDASKLTPKLKELNAKLEDNVRLSDAELDHLDKIIEKVGEGCEALSEQDLVLVKKLLSWPTQHVFPCIDLVRGINKAFPKYMELDDKLMIATANTKSPHSTCVRVALRLMVDITCGHTEQMTLWYYERIQPLLECVNTTTDKKFIYGSLARILHNITTVSSEDFISRDILEGITQLLSTCVRELDEKSQTIPVFALLVAMGNLISRHNSLKGAVDKALIEKIGQNTDPKVRVTASDITRDIK